MNKSVVSIVPYETPGMSVRKAVALAGGLDRLPAGARVFIKPNVVFWTRSVRFPKWGVITTSRVVQDMVALLKEHGAADIMIGEGPVVSPGDRQTIPHAFESLGYRSLERRFGVRCLNVFENPLAVAGLQVYFVHDQAY